MTKNFTCENTIKRIFAVSTFNWCHRYTIRIVRTSFFYINHDAGENRVQAAIPTKSESTAGLLGSVHDFWDRHGESERFRYVGITHSGFLRKQRPDAIVPYDQRRRGSKKYGGTESCNVSTDTVNFRQRRRL